jgi:hypothetical protein
VEDTGRYSRGSHKGFSDFEVIHVPLGLMPYPSYRGDAGSIFVGPHLPETEDKDKQTVPISVSRYELVMSNDFTEVNLSTSRDCRHWPLLASHTLTVLSYEAEVRSLESWEMTTELTERLWSSRVCRQALQLSSTVGFLIIHGGSCVSN